VKDPTQNPSLGDPLTFETTDFASARRALDELHAEVFLELLELRGQRRLTDEAAFCRTPEVARIGDRDEVAQILELEIGQACFFRMEPDR